MPKRKRFRTLLPTPIPISGAPPPNPRTIKSRRHARTVTTRFHQLTAALSTARNSCSSVGGDAVCAVSDEVERLEKELEETRGAYQEASRLSTSYHSTSRWVLRELGKRGWSGVRVGDGGGEMRLPRDGGDDDEGCDGDDGGKDTKYGVTEGSDEKKKIVQARRCRVLEIGAINTELIDAASKTRRVRADKHQSFSSSSRPLPAPAPVDVETNNPQTDDEVDTDGSINNTNPKYLHVPVSNLDVTAIDIRSSHPSIQPIDFFDFSSPSLPYDAVVCSMVLNCVPTPSLRGTMLTKIRGMIHPGGGMLFLVLPESCLTQSRYLNVNGFEELLVKALGFEIVEKKRSPKLCFWVLRRKKGSEKGWWKWKEEWGKTTVRYRGKKYRNDFGVVLTKKDLENESIE